MRVYISIDMEGVAGVLDRRQVWRGQDDYAEARSLMAGEANALAEGSFEAGATEVVVNDAHGDMCNLRPSDLHPRVELQIGSGKGPHAMIHRAEGSDVAIFAGYHAAAGTAGAVLEHSYSSTTVAAIRLCGDQVGELELNALVLGSWGVPVALVTGDDLVCTQAEQFLPGVRTVVVKQGFGYRAGRSLSPDAARDRLRAAAAEVVGGALPAVPAPPDAPLSLEVDFLTTAMAEAAALVPGTSRPGPRTVAWTGSTVDEVARMRGVLIALASTALGL